MVEGELLINPSRVEMTSSTLNLIVAGGPSSQVGRLTKIYSVDKQILKLFFILFYLTLKHMLYYTRCVTQFCIQSLNFILTLNVTVFQWWSRHLLRMFCSRTFATQWRLESNTPSRSYMPSSSWQENRRSPNAPRSRSSQLQLKWCNMFSSKTPDKTSFSMMTLISHQQYEEYI